MSEKLKIIIDADSSKAEQSIKKTDKAMTSLDGTTKKAIAAVGGFVAGIGALHVMKDAVAAFKEQEQATAALDASLASMGRTTDGLSKELKSLASQIQSEGIIGDEAIIKGQSFLATYADIADDVLPRATRLMADLAAKMGGDTVQAANMVGKASMGMVGELSRVGITFSEATKQSKDFESILEEMETQVGGMNEALANTASGALTQAGNLIGDMQEKLGGLIAIGLLPIIKVFSQWSAEMNDAADSADTVTTKGNELSMQLAKLADIAGNAVKGIALPFEVLGGAMGALGAQISFLMEGDFRKAMRAGRLYAADVEQKLLDITDPKIVNRFTLQAEKMIAAQKKVEEHGGGFDKGESVDKAISLQQAKYEKLHQLALEADAKDAERVMLNLEFDLQQMADERERLIEQKKWTDELDATYTQARIDRAQIAANKLGEIEDKRAKANIALQQQEAQMRKSATDKMFSDLSSLMNTHNRKAFEIGKAAAITQTIISTYEGAQKAFSSLSGIPVVGPALGVAAAAAAIAAGLARVQAIASTSFGSKSAGVAAGGGTPNVGGGGQGVPGSVPILPSVSSQKSVVSVNVSIEPGIYSAAEVSALVDTINEEYARRGQAA